MNANEESGVCHATQMNLHVVLTLRFLAFVPKSHLLVGRTWAKFKGEHLRQVWVGCGEAWCIHESVKYVAGVLCD